MRYILEDVIEYPEGYFYVILRDRMLDEEVCYLGHHVYDFLLIVLATDKDLMYIKQDLADKFSQMKQKYQERIIEK